MVIFRIDRLALYQVKQLLVWVTLLNMRVMYSAFLMMYILACTTKSYAKAAICLLLMIFDILFLNQYSHLFAELQESLPLRFLPLLLPGEVRQQEELLSIKA